MDEMIKALLEQTQAKAERYDELTKLLEYPEIVADRRYFLFLDAQRRSLETTARLRTRLLDLLEEEAFFGAYQTQADDREVEELRAEAERRRKTLDEVVRQLMKSDFACTQEQESAELEFWFESSVALQAQLIVGAYETFARANGFDVSAEHTDRCVRMTTKGRDAYACLKNETGVYRLIADGCKSSLSILVSPYEEDSDEPLSGVKIEVFHSSGAGGQNVNKVETAVRARHLPTGIVAVCQDERSQLRNKERALKMLAEKVRAAQISRSQTERKEKKKLLDVQKSRGEFRREYDFDRDTIKSGRNNVGYRLTATLENGMDCLIYETQRGE